jgi:hypothetical protein
MRAVVKTTCAGARLAQLQAQFLCLLPRITTHAQVRFRYFRCPAKREDAVAEVVAVCWKWFLRVSEQGKDAGEFAGSLADYAVRHVRSGRGLCGQEKSQDVLSALAHRRQGFQLEPLLRSTRQGFETFYADPHAQDHQDVLEARLQDNRVTPPADQAAFRIDYPAWLARLERRNRQIAQDMTLELTTLELAEKYRISPGRISQLRRLFYLDWRRFHGEDV